MNSNIYRQYDSRWRWWKYPKTGWYLNGCGCGCLSVFHCVIEIDKYAKQAPATALKTVYNYMKQYAVAGDGTQRAGITAGLKKFGFTNVIRLQSRPMSDLWKELAKGGRCGVLLFGGKKAPDGTRWTTSAHYVAYTGYKVSGGKHYLYMKDSGSRKHDKWWCYETSMRGNVIDAWVGVIPKAAATATTTASASAVTTASTATTLKAQAINEKALEYAWAYGTDASKYKKSGGAPTAAFKTAWKKYFPSKSTNTGCHSYVMLVLKACGYPTMDISSWSKILKYLRANFTELKVNFTQAQLRAGDIRVHKNSSGGYHIWVIVEKDGKFYRAEANQGSDNDRYAHLTAGTSGNTKKHAGDWLFRPKAVAYSGAYPNVNAKSRGYLMQGDSGAEVKKIQQFLNWYYGGTAGYKALAVDGSYGSLTRAAVIKFQKEKKLTADGTVGAKTLSAMKSARR